jgi:two-component system cell cycle sensor histidine kinase/response regulator CckA
MPDATPPRESQPTPLKSWQAYLFAIAATAATLGLRLALDRHLGGQATVVVFTVPIMLSAYLGGLGPGLLATALSCLAASYYLLPPINSFLVASEVERWQLFFVALAGLVVSTLNEALHRARRRAVVATREHHATGKALTESEGRYSALVEWSPEALVVHRKGKFVFVNPAAVKMFAAGSSDDLVGRSVLDLVHADSYGEAQARVNERGDSNARMPTIEVRIVRLDGASIDVEAVGTPIIYDGEPAVLGSMHDITERKEADLALRAERDRAQRYLDAAEVILLALDVQGRITLVNRYARSIFGWTEAELLGRDFIEVCVPARIRDQTREKLSSVLSESDTSVINNAIVTSSGEERMIEWRTTFLRDEEGRVVGTFSSGTDITKRDEAIEALRTAEERMRFALEGANVGIWDMDYSTGILRWSETIEAHYGLAPGAFDGRFETFVERTHPDDRASLLETVGQAMKSGADFTTLNRSIWPDGTIRRLSGAGRIHLGENGEPLRGVGISQDVTERYTLEAQFQQAQKMEAIGRLAGGVAHDFNNLLTAILGYCELLLTDTIPDDPRRGDIAEIQKAGTSAAGLTRQLLAFSRKQIIELTLLDLNEVVSGLKPMVGRLIGEDVTIQVGLADEPVFVKADRGQVEQVLVNLAVNARDAMPKGGTLTIETANVELDENYTKTHLTVKPGRYVRLTVSDTGTGMTPEVQARLFEPFFTTKEVGKGTGLGLATVHGVVARSGGSVNVYSEVGTGTSFKVFFPRADAETLPPEPTRALEPTPARTHTILVVEDSDGLRELARRLLARQGYTVLVAANAQDALRLFDETESIDVLLTDVVMPGTSGPELSRQLVERRPSLKVIYMSGYTDEAIVQHGVLNPGIALLNKPFTSDALERKIREVLSR